MTEQRATPHTDPTAAAVRAAQAEALPLADVHRIVDHLLRDGTREGLILADLLNTALGASARRRATDTAAPEGEVGTGADEGATGQDTGTAWVTRSTDCPEAPAQAHLPAAPVAVEGVETVETLAEVQEAEDRIRRHLRATTGGLGIADLDLILAARIVQARAGEYVRLETAQKYAERAFAAEDALRAGEGALREAAIDDSLPYAEIYDRLMMAEERLRAVEGLLAPHVFSDAISGRTHDVHKVHVRAADLRAALDPEATT